MSEQTESQKQDWEALCEEIDAFLHDNGDVLTDWVFTFLNSVKSFYKRRGFLTEKQVAAVDRIFLQFEMSEIDSCAHDKYWM